MPSEPTAIALHASAAVLAGPSGVENWFEPERYLGQRGHKYYSRASKYWLAACSGLFAQDLGAISLDDMGVALGTNFGGHQTLAEMDRVIRQDGPDQLSPMATPNFCINVIASLAAIRHGARRFNATLTTPEVAGIDSVFLAGAELAAGRCASVLAGAVEERQGRGADGALALCLTRVADTQTRAPLLSGFASAFCPDWDAHEANSASLMALLRRQMDRIALRGLDSCTVLAGAQGGALGRIAAGLPTTLGMDGVPSRLSFLEPGHASLEPMLHLADCSRSPGRQLFIYLGAAGHVRLVLLTATA